jgi:hypothetical protein
LFPFVCSLVSGRLTTKEDGYTSDFRGSQNYLRRRKNKTIIKAINAIIHDQNLSMILWAEACMTQYMSPHQILKNITPEEAFTGVKPKIEHFRIFGCTMYFSCTQREKVQARPFREKGYIYGITMNLRRHIRSTSLVRDRLRLAEMFLLKKR